MTDIIDLTSLTADIVAAYIGNNTVKADELAGLIGTTHAALSSLGAPPPNPAPDKPQAAVSMRKSLAKPDAILSMIDGKAYKMLRRHLTNNGYTPETYRDAFGLPDSYPMVAPAYAAARGELARKIGLGRKPRAEAAREAEAESTTTPARAPRAKTPRKLSGAAAPAKVRGRGEPRDAIADKP